MNGSIFNAPGLQLGEKSCGILQKEAGGRTHQLVIAHQDGFSRFAESVLAPLLIAGHHPIDLVNGHLKGQHAHQFGAVVDRSGDEGGGHAVGGGVGGEIGKLREILLL